jgi:predicted ATPase with chaperone activity
VVEVPPVDLAALSRAGAGEPSSSVRARVVAALSSLQLSARGFDRIRRVARTLADLDGVEIVQERHVAEAVQYRRAIGAVAEGRA